MPNSMYSPNKSYTYLVKFIPTGQVYYGVRTANKVSPENDLWKKYFTSSRVIKQLIEEHGLESFEFEVRRTFDNSEKAKTWEENVLKRMKVVRDDRWLNRTDHRSFDEHTEEAKEKIKQTCLERYGVEYFSQSKEIREKIKQTCLKNYGCENPSQSKEIKEKKKQTCLERYGYECPTQSEEVKEKAKQTCLKKYGVPYTPQTKEYREKYKKTCLEKYGVDNSLKSKEIQEKIKQTWIEKYGCENPVQSKEIKEKISRTMKKRYKCCQCDYISNQTWVTKHQKKTGHKGTVAQDDGQ